MGSPALSYLNSNPVAGMGIGYDNTTDPRKLAANQRMLNAAKGDVLNQEQINQITQDQQLQSGYQNTLDNIETPMAQGQGGYNSSEASQIMGNNNNSPYSLDNIQTSPDALKSNYLDMGEQQQITGNTSSYGNNFNPDAANQFQSQSADTQNQDVSQLQQNLNGAIDPTKLSQSQGYLDNAGQALTGTKNGVGGALGTVNSAITPSSFQQQYQMTPQQQQDIVTAAGVSAGTGFQAAADQAERQGAAAGASPLGVSAYRARMQQQGSNAAADAETNARIQASNAAAQRLQTGEQMRESSTLAAGQTGTAAQEYLGSQALGQANTAEQQRVADQQNLTGAQMQAATTGGQAALNTAATINQQQQGNTQWQAQQGAAINEAADQANSQRAAAVATNRQATNLNNQQTQYNQGASANAAESNRATTVANQRLGQQTQGLGYLQGQDAQANQNVQAGYGRQSSIYGTQASTGNTAAGLGINAAGIPTTIDKLVGAGIGAAGAASGIISATNGAAAAADGGVFGVNGPQQVTLGEQGPEQVIPASQWWKSKQMQQGMQNANRVPTNNPMGKLGALAGGALGSYLNRNKGGFNSTNMPLDKTIATDGGTPPSPTDYLSGGQQPQIDESGSPMDEGKVVTKPTVAILGEKEPEVVVPLGYRPGAKVRPSFLQSQRQPYGATA